MTDILLERQGWGNQTTGGDSGEHIIVSDAAGLRAALESPDPAYITFAASGVLDIAPKIMVQSNKTIDGRGKAVTLKTDNKNCLWLEGVENVIISDVTFDGSWTNYTSAPETGGGDAVHLQNTQRVWLHHCKLTHWSDGAFDAKPDSINNYLSATWNRFEEIYKPCLMNGTNISFGYNYVRKCGIRFPKANRGGCHTYNNVIEDWQSPNIQYTEHKGQIYSQRNIWIPKRNGNVGDSASVYTRKNEKAYGKVNFAKGKAPADPQFVSGSEAVANVTVCATDDQWDILKKSVIFGSGPRV